VQLDSGEVYPLPTEIALLDKNSGSRKLRFDDSWLARFAWSHITDDNT
jgi:hypothetical protein